MDILLHQEIMMLRERVKRKNALIKHLRERLRKASPYLLQTKLKRANALLKIKSAQIERLQKRWIVFVLLEAYEKLANNTDTRRCLEKQGRATGECLHALHLVSACTHCICIALPESRTYSMNLVVSGVGVRFGGTCPQVWLYKTILLLVCNTVEPVRMLWYLFPQNFAVWAVLSKRSI